MVKKTSEYKCPLTGKYWPDRQMHDEFCNVGCDDEREDKGFGHDF